MSSTDVPSGASYTRFRIVLGNVLTPANKVNLSMTEQVFPAPVIIPPSTLQISGSCTIGNEIELDKDQVLTFVWTPLRPDVPSEQMNRVVLSKYPQQQVFPDTLYPTYVPPQPDQQPDTFILPVPSSSSFFETYCTGVQSRNWNVFNTVAVLPQINSFTCYFDTSDDFVPLEYVSGPSPFEPVFKTIQDTSQEYQWLPITSEVIDLIYGQHWYTNRIGETAYGTYGTVKGSTPSTFDDHIHFCPPNGVLRSQESFTRSIYMVVRDDEFQKSTANRPHVFFINNTPDSLMNPSTTLPGRPFRPAVGHTYFSLLNRGAGMFYPYFPVPVSQAMMNARQREVYNYTQYTGQEALTNSSSFHNGINYVRQGLNNGLSFPQYPSSQYSSEKTLDAPDYAWGVWEDVAWYGTCDYPKNQSVGYGIASIIGNAVEGPNYMGFPEGYAVQPRYNYTGRMAFMFKRKANTNDFTELYTITTKIRIPAGVYTYPKLIYVINEEMNRPQKSGQFPFYKSIDLREEEVVFSATEYSDYDGHQYETHGHPTSVYATPTNNTRGRSVHFYAGNNAVINVGSTSVGCVIGPEGKAQFLGCFDPHAPIATQTTQFQPNVESVYELDSYVAHTAMDPSLNGNYGQAQTGTNGAKTTPDPWFIANTVGLTPYLLSTATHTILQALDLSFVQFVDADYASHPSTKQIVNGAAYTTKVNWNYANYNVINSLIASAPIEMTAYGSDLGRNCNGFIYCNPCGPIGVPGANGMQFISIGDGSDSENRFLAQLGFDPDQMKKFWTPSIGSVLPVEGAAYDNGNQPFFSKTLFGCSDQSPELYCTINPALFRIMRFKNTSQWATEANTYIAELYKMSTLCYGSPRNTTYNAWTPLSFPVTRHPILQLCTQERTKYVISDEYRVITPGMIPQTTSIQTIPKNALDIDCIMLPSLEFAQQFGAWPLDAIYSYTVGEDGSGARHAVDSSYIPNILSSVGYNMYKNHSFCARPLINRPVSLDDEATDQTISWGTIMPLAGFASSTTIVPPVSVANSFQNQQSKSIYGLWWNVPGTTGTFIGPGSLADANVARASWADANDIYFQATDYHSYSTPVSWISGNHGPRLGSAQDIRAQEGNLRGQYNPFNDAGMSGWGIIDLIGSAMCVVPKFSTFDGKTRPTKVGFDVYLQNVTDHYLNCLSFFNNPETQSDLTCLTRVPNWLNSAPFMDPVHGYVTQMGGINRIMSILGNRIPCQGRIVLDRIATYYFNACPMTSDNGFWGLVSKPELEHGSTPTNNVLRRMMEQRVGKETNAIGVVKNFSIFMPECLSYPFGPSTTTPNVQKSALASAQRFDSRLVAPLAFDPESNVDYSECVQITNVQSKIFEAPMVPVANLAFTQFGFILLRLSALQFYTPVQEYVNGVIYTDTITLTVAPTSNDALNTITFQSDISFPMPAQQLTYIRAELYDADGTKFSGVNNLKFEMLFTHTPNELTTAQADFQAVFQPTGAQ